MMLGPIYIRLRRVFEQSVNRRAVTMLRYIRCNMVILMAATEWLMLSFSFYIVCGFDSYTVLFKWPQRKFLPLPRWEGREKFQPSQSLFYIGYTSKWFDVRRCVLMQEATTCNISYGGTSFQYLATVLVSVFTLCYGPGLLLCWSTLYICLWIHKWEISDFFFLKR